MQLLLGVLFLIGIVVVAFAITIGAVALIRRDRHRGSGQLGHAMQELEGLFVESKKHVIEAEQDDHSEEEESGDPPEK